MDKTGQIKHSDKQDRWMDLIKKGRGYWNSWIEQNHKSAPFFVYADLSMLDLSMFNFHECRFHGCNFSYSCMAKADFSSCEFTDCDFSSANFNESDLSNSWFVHCYMNCVNLDNSNLDETVMKNTFLASGEAIKIAVKLFDTFKIVISK